MRLARSSGKRGFATPTASWWRKARCACSVSTRKCRSVSSLRVPRRCARLITSDTVRRMEQRRGIEPEGAWSPARAVRRDAKGDYGAKPRATRSEGAERPSEHGLGERPRGPTRGAVQCVLQGAHPRSSQLWEAWIRDADGKLVAQGKV